MYRKLGTRGSVFGVPSGPYAGRERTVAFARMSDSMKSRLVDALAGKGRLAPILSTATPRRSFRFVGVLFALFALWFLFSFGWPERESLLFVLGYVAAAGFLGWLISGRGGALSHAGSVIAPGAYLFPLDIIEANRDGTLLVVPLGGVREAAVSEQSARPALILSFQDGTTRTFPVRGAREAENAYAALESAQQTLERLTYGQDLSEAVNLDPFFEVRIDDTWNAIRAEGQNSARAKLAIALVVAAASGAALFGIRNKLAADSRDERAAAAQARLAAFEAQLAQAKAEASATSARPVFLPDNALPQPAQDSRIETRGTGIAAYEKVASTPEMVAIVKDLLKYVADHGGVGLSMYFAHDCRAADCASFEPSLRGLEDRLTNAFQIVLSQTLPRAVLPVDVVRVRPQAPALIVDYVVERSKAATAAIADGDASALDLEKLTMTFHTTLLVPGRGEARAFQLSMPPPDKPVTRPRDRSLFFFGASPTPLNLVLARGLDRLYDEVFGLFFTGSPRVPVSNAQAEDDLYKTFAPH